MGLDNRPRLGYNRRMQAYYLNSFDSTPLFVHEWPCESPKGLVIIHHDLGTHSGRLTSLCEPLAEGGYAVVAYDARAFGATARPEALGQAEKNNFVLSREDLRFVCRYFQRKYAAATFLMGQGYGAYMVLSCLQHGLSGVRGVLLASAGLPDRHMLKLMRASALPDNSAPDGVQKGRQRALSLRAGTSGTDGYLTGDAERLESYRNDPLCGVVPTAYFLRDMWANMVELTHHGGMGRLPRTVQYAVFCGMDDPMLGEGAEDATRLLEALRRLKPEKVRFFGYEGAKHALEEEAVRARYGEHILHFLDAATE